MDSVLAQAIVDVEVAPADTADGMFKVTVWGQPPYDYTATYEISAKSDTLAAQQGIDWFVEKASALGPKGT